MSSDYILWSYVDVPNSLVLKDLLGVRDSDQLATLQGGGEIDADDVEELRFTADPDYPNDMLLVDTHGNTDRVTTVSPKLKAFLDARNIPNIQFLPVTFLNHKGKVAAEYFLLHPTLCVDCLDAAASGAKFSRVNPDRVRRVKKVVLSQDNIPADAEIFKIKGLTSTMVIKRTIADAITNAGITGVDWIELEDYS